MSLVVFCLHYNKLMVIMEEINVSRVFFCVTSVSATLKRVTVLS